LGFEFVPRQWRQTLAPPAEVRSTVPHTLLEDGHDIRTIHEFLGCADVQRHDLHPRPEQRRGGCV